MVKVEFKENKDSCVLIINGYYIGIFSTKKEAKVKAKELGA